MCIFVFGRKLNLSFFVPCKFQKKKIVCNLYMSVHYRVYVFHYFCEFFFKCHSIIKRKIIYFSCFDTCVSIYFCSHFVSLILNFKRTLQYFTLRVDFHFLSFLQKKKNLQIFSFVLKKKIRFRRNFFKQNLIRNFGNSFYFSFVRVLFSNIVRQSN